MAMIRALILVLSTSLVVVQSGPDLPDAFQQGPEVIKQDEQPTAAVVPPAAVVPSVVFSQTTGPTTETIRTRILVSEPWCQYCPAAKQRFLDSGGLEKNVITIAEARALYGRVIRGVPAEFTVDVQVEQQAAVATISGLGADLSADAVAACLAMHLLRSSAQVPSEPLTFGSLFNVDVPMSQGSRDILRGLLVDGKVEFATAGLTLSTGDRTTLARTSGRLSCSPGLKCTAKKFGVSLSATLNAVALSPDASAITFELQGVPDLTVNLK